MSKKSKKLKQLEEMRLQQQIMQQQQQQQQQAGPQIICQPMNNGMFPVAPASNFVQLTPIVQPIALVPYSTQQQPLLTFIDDEDYDIDY